MVLLGCSASVSDAHCDNPRSCLTREGRTSLIAEPGKSNRERKLFVTRDEVARYLFLTNGPFDGDRSVAIYRAPGERGARSFAYWVTTTQAAGSLIRTTRGIRVDRFDAPLPAATAAAVHRLWVAFLEATRVEEDTIICSPTGIFATTTANGTRLTAGTWTIDEDCLCLDLMNLGEKMIEYPQLPPAKRPQAARHIEHTSHALFQRVLHVEDT